MVAALHFNENSERQQKTTRAGELEFAVSYPKSKYGEHTVKKILEDPTYGKYVTLEPFLSREPLVCGSGLLSQSLTFC